MLRRIGILSACAVLGLATVLWGKDGTVYTKTPAMHRHGDLTVHENTVDVVDNGIKITFQKGNVAQIIYDDDVPNIIAERMSKLQPTDVQGRIDLAQFAEDFKRYDDARRILTDAQKIDPGNSRVSNMLAALDQLARAQPPATAPTTVPSPNPIGPNSSGPNNVANNPGNTGNTAPTTAPAPAQLRLLTAQEINTIKLDEWQENQLTVHVRVDADVRKAFTDESGMKPAEFVKLTPAQQAWMIYTKGSKDLWSGVHLISDPPAMQQYRQMIQRQVITGCAASSCHGGDKGGSFRLFPGESDAVVYTDFLILNKYGLAVDGKMYPMINREVPLESLLLSEMLPPELAMVPHPKVEGYRGMSRTKNDPKYVSTVTWLRDALNPVRPTFDMDLTKPPPKADKTAPPQPQR